MAQRSRSTSSEEHDSKKQCLRSPSFSYVQGSIPIAPTNYVENITESRTDKKVYRCDKCGRVWPSYQALGGHKTSHSIKRSTSTNTYSSIASTDAGGLISASNVPAVNPHGKTYQCSKCNEVFPSGQALGGHMGAHWDSVVGGGRNEKKAKSCSTADNIHYESQDSSSPTIHEFELPQYNPTDTLELLAQLDCTTSRSCPENLQDLPETNLELTLATGSQEDDNSCLPNEKQGVSQ